VEDDDDIVSLLEMHDLVEPIFETFASFFFVVMLGLSASHAMILRFSGCPVSLQEKAVLSFLVFRLTGQLFCPMMEEF
jgi:hypothetical protein